MAALAVPAIQMTHQVPRAYAALATVTLADGSTLTMGTAGSARTPVPLNQVPAAIVAGFAIADGAFNSSTCKLLRIPATDTVYPQAGTLTLPDGVTTSTITGGLVVVPNQFVSNYLNYGWMVVA